VSACERRDLPESAAPACQATAIGKPARYTSEMPTSQTI